MLCCMTPPRAPSAAPPDIDVDTVRGWFTGRLPDDWFLEPVEVVLDREEITLVGRIPEPTLATDASEAERAAALGGRVRAWREQTRAERMAAASEAQHRYGRAVSWGARCGEHRELFTTLGVPVMTRLRQAERIALDTLVAAGVARSRSEALAWCVALVGRHESEWLDELRAAMEHVGQVRSSGPRSDAAHEGPGAPD